MTAPIIAGRPAPLTRVFGRIRPVLGATDAEDALWEVLRPVAGSVWPEVAWPWGVLTATAFPVEMAWASRDTAVRWTCEVAGPEEPEADRLRLAVHLAARLGGSTVAAGPWAGVQRGQRLRWGAWLGVRQCGGSRQAEVYLELQAGTLAGGVWSAAGVDLTARVTGSTWRMAGVNDDGSVEPYARVPELSWRELEAAARLVGDAGRLVDLVGELTQRSGRGLHSRRPAHPSGLSLVVSASGRPVALTWFAIAKHVWPDDAAVHVAVSRTLNTVAHPSGARDGYRALSSGPDDGRWRHGMVGAGADGAGRAWLQAGIRPT